MGILGLLPVVTPIIEKVLDFIPDPAEKAKAAAAAAQAQLDAAMQAAAAQTDIDKIEASSTNIFVAGWRPFVGWVGGAALAYQCIVQPLLAWLLGLVVLNFGGTMPPLPVLDTSSLTTVLLSLLGLGAMRSYDKVNGKSAGH